MGIDRIGDIVGSGDKCVKAGTCVSSNGGPFPVENYDAMHTLPGMVMIPQPGFFFASA